MKYKYLTFCQKKGKYNNLNRIWLINFNRLKELKDKCFPVYTYAVSVPNYAMNHTTLQIQYTIYTFTELRNGSCYRAKY